MNAEAQRIAIAEACGKLGCWPHAWHEVQRFTSGYVNPPYEPRGGIPYKRFQCEKCKKEVVTPRYDDTIENLPNYLSDLNAMHEAEKTQIWPDSDLCDTYFAWLDLDPSTAAWHATAAQRAEAFLR